MTSTGILGKDQSTQSIDPPKGPVYVAIRDWEAQNSAQLSIKKEEKLEIKKERTEGWWLARSLDADQEGLVPFNYIKKDDESELSTLESLELFHYAMTENVDIPKIKEIKTKSNVERASLFLSLIKQDSVLLDQLRKKEHVHLSLGIHTVMIIGRTPSGVETAKLVQFEIKEGFNEYCTDPNVIGIASTVLHCHLNLSQGTAPYTVAVMVHYTFSTSSLSPGYYPFRLEAHDQCGYTCSIVSVFTVQPIDRICCPVILRNSARLLILNSTSVPDDSNNGSCSNLSQESGSEFFKYSYDIKKMNNLLKDGADPNRHSELGRTALHWAASYRLPNQETQDSQVLALNSMLGVLVCDDSVDINAKDEAGCTPLNLACRSSNYHAVQIFLSQDKVMVDEADNEGRTPLHTA
uniref:SH3 domain-containing protein n=1 Tax=Amphimedon queenslandica TaxID=400682 RepID=A0A1X7TX08_AMPQE